MPDEYGYCFSGDCTEEDMQLIISGTEENREILINIIATKSNNSNIKGDWEWFLKSNKIKIKIYYVKNIK